MMQGQRCARPLGGGSSRAFVAHAAFPLSLSRKDRGAGPVHGACRVDPCLAHSSARGPSHARGWVPRAQPRPQTLGWRVEEEVGGVPSPPPPMGRASWRPGPPALGANEPFPLVGKARAPSASLRQPSSRVGGKAQAPSASRRSSHDGDGGQRGSSVRPRHAAAIQHALERGRTRRVFLGLVR